MIWMPDRRLWMPFGAARGALSRDKAAAATIAFDGSPTFTDFASNADTWDGSRTFTANANLIAVALSWENNCTADSVTIDPGGAAISLTKITDTVGATGQSRTSIWAGYAFTPQTGAKTVRASFSAALASGSMGIWTFTGATKLPIAAGGGNTSDDFSNQQSSAATVLTGSIVVDSGEENGMIVATCNINGAPGTVTSGGGLEATVHTYTGSSGGHLDGFSHNLGPLSGTEQPSFTWSPAARSSASFVLVT